MDVSTAVAQRRSCRAFLPDPLPAGLVADILTRAGRAASGGNLQPWRVYSLEGEPLTRFRAAMADRTAAGQMDTPEYPVYPSPLKEPYRSQRFAVGETMYAQLGIPRDDKPARLQWFAKNYQFFGAPAAAFIFVDRDMGQAQWTDLGGYLTSAMLLAEEAGLATCAQEAWVTQNRFVAEFVNAPADWMLFCGISIGRPDHDAAVNKFMTDRADSADWLFSLE